MSHSCAGEGGCCNRSQPASQSLDELEFERGLWSACCEGDLPRVRELLSRGHDPGGKDTSGYTPLHYAARGGYNDICKVLLSSGADVNAATSSGTTPLHRAAYRGHLDVVVTLLEAGAGAELVDSDGMTSAHKAKTSEVLDLILRRRPACASLRDNKGRLPSAD